MKAQPDILIAYKCTGVFPDIVETEIDMTKTAGQFDNFEAKYQVYGDTFVKGYKTDGNMLYPV